MLNMLEMGRKAVNPISFFPFPSSNDTVPLSSELISEGVNV